MSHVCHFFNKNLFNKILVCYETGPIHKTVGSLVFTGSGRIATVHTELTAQSIKSLNPIGQEAILGSIGRTGRSGLSFKTMQQR